MVYLFTRRQTEGNADVGTESGLRVGDTFGFDYNEMAVSTFHWMSFEKRLQSKCCIMSKSSVPPLPFLLFCLLCCSNSLMKHKQKCFLFPRRSKAASHEMPTSACVFLAESLTYVKVGFECLSLHYFHLSLYPTMKLYFRLSAPRMALTNTSQQQRWMCSSTSCQLTWWTKKQAGLDMHTGMLTHAGSCQRNFLH